MVERTDGLEQRELDFPSTSTSFSGLGEDSHGQKPDEAGDDSNTESMPSARDEAATTDDVVNLANSYLPSAMGLSCYLVPPSAGLIVSVHAGVYEAGEHTFTNVNGSATTGPAHFRRSVNTILKLTSSDLPGPGGISHPIVVSRTEHGSVLVLRVVNRSREAASDLAPSLYTFSLVNTSETSGERTPNEMCFFQVGFSVRAADDAPCLAPFRRRQDTAGDEDTLANDLLYRDVRTYAIGHGCAAAWDEAASSRMATGVRTEGSSRVCVGDFGVFHGLLRVVAGLT
jgi:hypothetical protein